jgi:hypothetical protein
MFVLVAYLHRNLNAMCDLSLHFYRVEQAKCLKMLQRLPPLPAMRVPAHH